MNIPFLKKNDLYGFVDKNFTYLVVVIVVAIVFLFTYFLIVPTLKEIRDVNVLELQQKQDRLTEMQQLSSELKTMRDKYTQVNYNDIQRIETILPKGFDKQRTFLQLEQFGAQSGLTVTSISIEEHLTTAGTTSSRRTTQTDTSTDSFVGGVEEVSISMTVAGVDSYDGFKQFLSIIESYAPLMTLSSIDYPISSKGLSLTLTTHYLSET